MPLLQSRRFWLTATVLVLIIGFVIIEPVAQSPAYHHFADRRTLFGIPHFWNVMSNAAFLAIGAWGLAAATRFRTIDGKIPAADAYLVLFAGMILTAFGSSWYHLDPSNATLVWDRLAMTVSFAGLFAAVIAEHFPVTALRRMLAIFLVIGASSVIYWYRTEIAGVGDLRLYAIVQFFPMIAIPAIIVASRRYDRLTRAMWILVALYVASKLAEQFDAEIYAVSGFGGHAIKHLLAALAPVALIGYIVGNNGLRNDS